MLYFRNMPISSEFHSSRLQLRMQPTSNRPLWQWQRRSRIALAHHQAPQTLKAKLKLTRDVRLKAIRADAVKLSRVRASVAPTSSIIITMMHHPPFSKQYLFMSFQYYIFLLLAHLTRLKINDVFFNATESFCSGRNKEKNVFCAKRIQFLTFWKLLLPFDMFVTRHVMIHKRENRR